jgi:hypothetical protein
MNDRVSKNWRALYTAAYLERDPAKLMERIEQAERAIARCQQEITAHPDAEDDLEDERRILALCLQDLRILRERESVAGYKEPRSEPRRSA